MFVTCLDLQASYQSRDAPQAVWCTCLATWGLLQKLHSCMLCFPKSSLDSKASLAAVCAREQCPWPVRSQPERCHLCERELRRLLSEVDLEYLVEREGGLDAVVDWGSPAQPGRAAAPGHGAGSSTTAPNSPSWTSAPLASQCGSFVHAVLTCQHANVCDSHPQYSARTCLTPLISMVMHMHHHDACRHSVVTDGAARWVCCLSKSVRVHQGCQPLF